MSTYPVHDLAESKLRILAVPAFNDNYIWLVTDGQRAVVVDPGSAEAAIAALKETRLKLEAILLTHHHADHIGGVPGLLDFANGQTANPVQVIGPDDARIPHITHRTHDGERFSLLDGQLQLSTLSVPGHTETHVAYLSDAVLFCGDTLFSAGCGRLLGGTAAQLHQSLQRLAALPEHIQVFCAHEYTLSNLRFAQAAEPDNTERDAWFAECQALRAAGRMTLPSTIAREKRINPFLRTQAPSLHAQVAAQTGTPPADDLACFTALRQWKDHF